MTEPHPRTAGPSTASSTPGAERPPVVVGRRPWRLVSGVPLLVVPVVVAVRCHDALLANHPAYPLTLLAAAVLGVALVVTGLRVRPVPEPVGWQTSLRVAGSLAGVGVAALLLWAQPRPAEPYALDALRGSSAVVVSDTRAATTYEPATTPRAGLVLYPGARVDPRAYAVLVGRVAGAGYRVVVPKCPFDVELLCGDAAAAWVDGSMPWAVGGHSLGGVVASGYASHDDQVDGLVLWAAYPAVDLSGRTGLAVASVSGSSDALASPDKVAARRDLLPAATTYTVVPGGIHSFFGDYGIQEGDGEPATSRAEAQDRIVAATLALLASLR